MTLQEFTVIMVTVVVEDIVVTVLTVDTVGKERKVSLKKNT